MANSLGLRLFRVNKLNGEQHRSTLSLPRPDEGAYHHCTSETPAVHTVRRPVPLTRKCHRNRDCDGFATAGTYRRFCGIRSEQDLFCVISISPLMLSKHR